MAINNKIKPYGFTLIEMSIVLTILGLVAAGAFTILAREQETEKREETTRRMHVVIDALKKFMRAKGTLPCPADGNLALNNLQFGRGQSTSTGTCSASNLKISGTNPNRVVMGILPLYNLGLPDMYMFDAWDNKFSYAVTEKLTAAENLLTSPEFISTPIANTMLGLIDVQDAANYTLLDANGNGALNNSNGNGAAGTAENALAVLIGHGPNGHGAWLYKGSSQVNRYSSLAGHEMEDSNSHILATNTTLDTTYRALELRLVAGSPTSTNTNQIFDDILTPLTKAQICVDSAGSTTNLSGIQYCTP
jgi:prepilin-type N-terminal cleavage/methylation domain-containing protein